MLAFYEVSLVKISNSLLLKNQTILIAMIVIQFIIVKLF